MRPGTESSPFLKRERAHLGIWLSAIALIVTLIVPTLVSLQLARMQSLQHARETAEVIAKSVNQTFIGLIDAADNALLTSADEVTRQLREGALNATEVTGFLQRQTNRLPHIAYVRLSDEAGDLLYGPNIRSDPINIADRDYFLTLKNDAQSGRIVGAPIIGRTDGKWVWPIARRLNKPDGTFSGVVVAGISIDEIQRMLLAMPVGQGGVVALRDSQLGVIARNSSGAVGDAPPGDKRLTSKFSDAFQKDGSQGTYIGGGAGVDRIDRVFFYVRNVKYGYLVNVGVSLEAALADWRDRAWRQCLFLLGFTLLLLGFAWYATRALRRQQADAERLAFSRQQFDTLSNYDPLTNLPNRQALEDRLTVAIEKVKHHGMVGAILFLDLDEFKAINDSQGNKAGDWVLQEVGRRLASCISGNDTVARAGGDEFVILLEALATKRVDAANRAESIGEVILATLRSPIQIEGNQSHLTASIGVALLDKQSPTADQLLAQTAIAMTQAKHAGRNCIRFFDPIMQDEITKRIQLDIGLRSAIDQHEFRLYYQVQVDEFWHVTGAEALIRWMHPDRGVIGPIEFIPRAEESGLIQKIGQWVLNEACQQLKQWESNPATRELVLSINVSARQFRQTDFVDHVFVAIERYGINPERLALELTESVMLGNLEDTIRVMNALHSKGIKLSLDDFGTGYSSLQYLKQLPIDQLKIDQSFVSDIGTDRGDDAIICTILAMAHALHLDVIAEGVETTQQRDILINEGCKRFQGYLFGKPVPIAEFEANLSRQTG